MRGRHSWLGPDGAIPRVVVAGVDLKRHLSWPGRSRDGRGDWLLALRLHSRLADAFCDNVAALIGALDAGDGAELRERVCSLVEAVRLIPEAGWLRIGVPYQPPSVWTPELAIAPRLEPSGRCRHDLREMRGQDLNL